MLGLKPGAWEEFSPADLIYMAEGDQRRWNRTCELATWMVLMIASAIHRFGDGGWLRDAKSIKSVLLRFTPPGYRHEPAKDEDLP